VGVLGVLPGIIGCMEALEAIKLILGIGRPLIGRLLIFDGLEFDVSIVSIRRNPACPICGDRPTITRLIDYDAFCGVR
jgi:adenylyltransferase/sulfurtransferase